MECAACHSGNAAGNRFCTGCGAALVRRCPACGAEAESGARFCGQCGTALDPRGPSSADAREGENRGGAQGGAGRGVQAGELGEALVERRQVTIVFFDLVGSTRLAHELDPEEYGDLIREYRAMAAEHIGRYGGTIAQFLGDGLLVYFGYPAAYENAPVRAVHAALAVIDSLRGSGASPRDLGPLRVRVGVETGVVLVGTFASGGAVEPMAVFGDAPNIAARLQEQAEPGHVVLGPAAARLVSGAFRLRPRGPVRLKGLVEPVEVQDVLGPHGDGGETLDPVLTRFFDREAERASVWGAWERAVAGTGQALLLQGEPGIGKSRLVRTLRERLGASAGRWLVCAGSPFDGGSAYAPVRRLLRDWLRRQPAVPEGDGDLPAALRRLTGWTAEEAQVAEELLDLAAPNAADASSNATGVAAADAAGTGAAAVRAWTPARKRRVLEQALARWLLAHEGGGPSVVVVEDLHWLDASTAALVGILVERAPAQPVLVVATTRPGPVPGWSRLPHCAVHTLSPLPEGDVAAMIGELAGDAGLPPALVAGLAERADGVPLYVEELTRTARERAAAGVAAAVPETLRDALMERLDRTALAKAALQAGAVIGRAFPASLAARLTGLDPQAVTRALDGLVADSILFRRQPDRDGHEAEYVFRHQLIRDAAYEALLLRRRQRLHGRVAELLREEGTGRPDIVAYHLAQGGQAGPAAEHYARAAALAHSRGALLEAVAHCDAVDALLPKLPDEGERRRRQVAASVQRGAVLIALNGFASPDVERCYARAAELSKGVEDLEARFGALWGRSAFLGVRGPLGQAHRVGTEMLRLARGGGNPLLAGEAERRVGLIQFMQGNFRTAARHYAAAGACFARLDRPGAALYGTCPLLLNRANQAWLRWFEGDPASAAAEIRAVVAEAEAAQDSYTAVFALGLEAAICQMRGDLPGTREAAERCAATSRRQLYRYWEAWGEVFAGWADALLGEAGGTERLRSGLAAYRSTGAIQLELYATALLADALAAGAGTSTGTSAAEGAALAAAAEVLDGALDGGEPAVRYALAPALLTRARVLAALGRTEEGVAALRRAEGTARRQHSPMLVLRARLALAELDPAGHLLTTAQVRSLRRSTRVEAGSADEARLRALLRGRQESPSAPG